MAWYINDVNIDNYPIQSLSLSFASQAVDKATLVLDQDLTATPQSPFGVGTVITIKQDTTIVFKGTCQEPDRSGSEDNESVVIDVLGVWDILERTVLVQSNAYDGGSAYTSRLLFSDTLTNIINYILTYDSNITALITKGTVDLPNISMYNKEYRDITYAEGIKNVLKCVNGAITTIDYSTSPPTIHILKPDSTYLSSLTVNIEDEHTDVKYQQRNDIKPPAVYIFYERKKQTTLFDARTNISQVNESYDLEASQIYPASPPSSPVGCIVYTVLLKGEEKITTKSFFFSASFGSLQSKIQGSNRSFLYVGDLLNMTGCPVISVSNKNTPHKDYPYCVGFNQSITYVKGLNNSGYSLSNLYPLADKKNAAGWQQVPPEDLWDQSIFGFSRVDINSEWSSSYQGATQYTHQWSFLVCSWYSGDPYNHTLSKTETETDPNPENPPASNLAQIIYDQYNINVFEGSVLNKDVEPSIPSALTRKISIKESTVEKANGVIQQIKINLTDGSTSLAFGPPTHLSPQDFLNLLLNK